MRCVVVGVVRRNLLRKGSNNIAMSQAKEAGEKEREKFYSMYADACQIPVGGGVTQGAVDDFIRSVDTKTLILYLVGNDRLVCTVSMPHDAIKKKAVYFVKTDRIRDQLKFNDLLSGDILSGELNEAGLQNLALVSHQVYFPLLSNPANRSGWSGPTSKEVMLKFSAFLSTLTMTVGQAKGETLLPAPPPEAFDEELDAKERAHLLETSVIDWIKQIQNVLSLDPDNMLRQAAAAAQAQMAAANAATAAAAAAAAAKNTKKGAAAATAVSVSGSKPETAVDSKSDAKSKPAADATSEKKKGGDDEPKKDMKELLKEIKEHVSSVTQPDPLHEMTFWANKAADLSSLDKQLRSEVMSRARRLLEELKSPFSREFEKLADDVVRAQEEATQNVRYLRTLEEYFIRLREESDITKLEPLFYPMLHTMLLVWQNSTTYNTELRLVVLVKEICNALITQGQQFVSGEKIFRAIAAETLPEVVVSLKQLIRVLERFKQVFDRYRVKAAKALQAPGSWQTPNAVLFTRLDAFLERCADVLDFTKIVQQFKRLEKINLSGNKGKTLTEMIHQIYVDFDAALSFPRSMYDIMDVTRHEFDDDFYRFRCTVKELERRLSHVLTTAFEDCNTINARFKLLDSFEGLLERPIIKDELDKKQRLLLEAYNEDLRAVEELFHTNKATPRIDSNLPPIAGSLWWCRGLQERVHEPMDKLKGLGSTATRHEMKDIEKVFDSFNRSLSDYEKKNILIWTNEIDRSSQEKLKQPLLRRNDELLVVNFDDALVRLLREVKYFLLLGVDVPPAARKVYEKAETYRKQIGNLEIITFRYNDMVRTLLPVEKPLVEKDLAHINAVLERGLGELNWNSPQVDPFLAEAMDVVKRVWMNVNVMKENFKSIRNLMQEYAKHPLIDRKNKPQTPQDFEDNLRKLWATRHELLRGHGETINKSLAQTRDVLKSPATSTQWRAYVEYVQVVIRDSLATCIVNSIKFLCDQLDDATIEKDKLAPLLDIRLTMYAQEVQFTAEDAASDAANTAAVVASAQAAVQGGAPGQPATGALDSKTAASGGAATTAGGSLLDKAGRNKGRRDVWQIVSEWVETFFEIGNMLTRIDNSHYGVDLRKNEFVSRQMSTLKKLLEANQKKCEQYREEYTQYDYLWKRNRITDFAQWEKQIRGLADPNKAVAATPSAAGGATNRSAATPTPGTNTAFGFASSRGDSKGNAPASTVPPAGEKDDDDDDQKGAASADENKIPPLPLAKYEEKILYYRDRLTEIVDKKTPIEIGWLRIQSQNMKDILRTWTHRWMNMYVSSLYNDVEKKLDVLDRTMTSVREGLQKEQNMKAGDSDTLKEVLGYIHTVLSHKETYRAMFGPLRETVALLKKYGRNLDERPAKLLAESPMKWDETVDMVYSVKKRVNQMQGVEVSKIKQKVESFDAELDSFFKRFRSEAPFVYEFTADEAYESIFRFHNLINSMDEKGLRLNDLEKVFELTVSKHHILKKIRSENKHLKSCWDMVSVVRTTFDDWKKTLWDKITDTSLMVKKCNEILKEVLKLPNEVKSWAVFTGLQREVTNLLTVLPLVQLLHSESMSDRHWKQLKESTKKEFTKDANFCLADLLALELHQYGPIVEDIVDKSKGEKRIHDDLRKIERTWSDLLLTFANHKKTDIKVIAMSDDVLGALVDNMAKLQTMQASARYVEHYLDRVNKWQKDLSTTEQVLQDWLEVQSRWGNLEAIYITSKDGSHDIRDQLPEDSDRFDEIDNSWRTLMAGAVNTPNVIAACTAPGRQQLLKDMKIGLQLCQRSLFQYLETKRKQFPRFYFLDDKALLTILSQGYNPQAVQEHFGGCFEGIKRLEFELDEKKQATKTALGMHSKEGNEYVEFMKKFQCQGAVEDWLNALVRMMRDTLREILMAAKFSADHWDAAENTRHEWALTYPAQIAVTASQIIWTEEVNSQFDQFQDGNDSAMRDYAKTLRERLSKLIEMVMTNLNRENRIKIITLITIDVHNRDVIDKLIKEKVQDPQAFAWQSQMRLTWKGDTKDAVIRVADAPFTYSYEYVGNTGRLVITPLTDRCYITLTQALRLNMGGAPAGPAGTGKTETTKDLGRAMGLPVYVFNCSEQMNVQSMGAVWKGLCQTGAWGCFDEFNRIKGEVLSVISAQVSSILTALRAQREEFDFMGEIIKLVPTVGPFITMNPDYTGRTALPENIKALFRSCAMVIPDMDVICENMLFSEGFQDANSLSKKFVTLYSLASELLSQQRHYDWSLRACKAVLNVAARFKRLDPNPKEEHRILMLALRDFNTPKLLHDDELIFKQLIDDLFPDYKGTERKVDMSLQKSLEEVAKKESKLQPEERFLQKCAELSELMDIRHSIFILGPAGAGKSEIWKTLAKAYRRKGDECVHEYFNPKAITNNELYGWLTKTDWHPGVLGTIMANMSRNQAGYNDKQKWKWIVLDGDIDSKWIESLNSVMDDSKLLTLPSNERIPVTPSMRLVFEISHLAHATPATVSRAGILYVSPKEVGWRPFQMSWVESRTDEVEKNALLALFLKYFSMNPEYLSDMLSFKRMANISEINIIMTLCRILESLLNRHKEEKRKIKLAAAGRPMSKEDERFIDPAFERELYEAYFVFATIWSFGGSLLMDKLNNQRSKFSDWWKKTHTSVKFATQPGMDSVQGYNVFDYYVDDRTGKMTPWRVPAFIPPEDAYLVTKMFVPTVDTVRLQYLLDLLVSNESERQKSQLLKAQTFMQSLGSKPAGSSLDLKRDEKAAAAAAASSSLLDPWMQNLLLGQQRPVLLVGTNGTGKTSIASEYLRSIDESTMTMTTINLNYYTDARSLQRSMEAPIDRRVGHQYGPKAGNKQLIYFIDDLNMPMVDPYGTQSSSALIRQHIDYGFWWDTEKIEKKIILNVQYVACMNPAVGSFLLDDRLQSRFSTFTCPLPNATSLGYVFNTIMRQHFSNFSKEVQEIQEKLVSVTTAIHDEVSKDFTANSPSKFHYQFSLRELSSIFQGLCLAHPRHYNASTMIELWAHECIRVFSDRFTTSKDVDQLMGIMQGKILNNFRDHWKSKTLFVDEMKKPVVKERRGSVSKTGAPPKAGNKSDSVDIDAGAGLGNAKAPALDSKAVAAAAAGGDGKKDDKEMEMFGGNAPPAPKPEAKVEVARKWPVFLFTSFVEAKDGENMYLPVNDLGRLKSVLEQKLDLYNKVNARMQLEMFDMAMEHVCRIVRIIENPQGNALLVGFGGSGKQSLARLASFICGYEIVQLQVHSTYGLNDLKTALQALYRTTGVNDIPVTFLLTDAQIVNDEWLVYINDILSSGYIAELFSPDDLKVIFGSLRNLAKAKGVPDTPDAMERFFISRVRANLHVILCFSPVGEKFRVRCRKFPALTNCTSIDWFHPWPRDALISVASRFLADVDVGIGLVAPVAAAPQAAAPVAAAAAPVATPAPVPIATSAGVQSTGAATNAAGAVPGAGLAPVAGAAAVPLPTPVATIPSVADPAAQAALRAQIAQHMAEVHCTVADEGRVADKFYQTERRRVYTTPKSFLELISFYKEFLAKKRATLDKDTLRISRGINTIASAHHNVELLKGDLDSTIKQVGVKDTDTNVLMAKLAIDAKSMEEQQAVAAIERGKAKVKFDEAAVLKEATDKELAAAQPGLLEAQAAVAGLSKQDLDELKRYDKPVEPIRMVIKAVMTMIAPNSKSDPITARNTVMKNPNLFKQQLENYAKENATKLEEKILGKLEPILAKPYFTADGMQASGSKAAASLCRWVVNLVKYYKVYKAMEPKIIEQQQAAEQFKEANDKVDALNKKVEAMVAKVNAVKGNLSHAEMSSAQIKDEAKRLEKRMKLALRLVNGLDDHQKRWTKDLAQYREQARTMIGDVLLAAAFVSYVGPFNAKFRSQLWRQTWIPDLLARRIPLADKFNTSEKCEDPLSLLASDSDFAMWKNDGLAADLVSLQNGAILTQCARWPLMIDPQLQGITWVKRKLEKEAEQRAKDAAAAGKDAKGVEVAAEPGFRVIAPHSKNWLQTIIRGVINGETIVLEGIGEEIDAFLDPVLSRATMQKGNDKFMKVGHEEVLYNDKFRLILQTKLSNPHYKPEIAAQCTIINFIVTEEGLEENLLAMVVNREKADVEEKKSALARSINNFTVSLQVFENSILQRLNDAPADILGEESLIISLEETKDKAKAIAEKVLEAKKAERDINRNRDEYRMVAAEASWLYFLLNSLHNIDHMYQYSLDAFTNFFLKAMKKTPAAAVTEQRVQLLRENIRYTIFAWVNRGLFGQHRLIFMGKLVFKLMQKNVLKEKFNQLHYDFLLHGIKNWKRPGELPKSKIEWLPKTAWEALNRLIGIEPFGKLLPDIEASPNRFKEWYNKNRPELAALPLEWRNKDDKEPFQKLMIVRALRPDRITAALEHYVNIVLPNGKAYTECDAGKSFQDVLRMSLEDSTPHTPIFFILSPGSDPTKTVEVLAKHKFGDLAGKYHRIALGEGQDVVALATLDLAHREGHWVVLENIHLMPAWTFELEKKLDEFTGEKTHDDFRVFLSAEPSDLLPIGLLERSIKLTNEPPSGLKPNLKRAFATLLEKDPKNPDVADFEFKDPKAKMILFGLCHFHAIIIERIRYGTKGWNRVYPFNTGDLQNCNTVLSNYFDGGNDKIPWKDLQYIFGEILYGGHITDKNDRLLCMTYLDHFLKDTMLDEMELFPFNESFPEERFRAPPVLTPAGYIQYIDENLLGESPVAFGMHPNAEIAVRTAQCENLFRTIIDLEPRSGGAEASSHSSVEASNKEIVAKILEDVKSYSFDLPGIIAKMGDERGPYENVFLQECERMNVLAAEIQRSCRELEAGAAGELQLSESMEKLQISLALSRVPDRWAELAYPSMRSLWSWFDDLAKRHMQLSNWSDEPTTIPMVTSLNYLFNPQSFLTAIMQANAQKTHSELDKLVIQTDVKGKYEVADHARDGAYITGLYVEGARWNVSSGQLEECGPRDINYPMPIINCRAIPRDKEEKVGVFRCPVYKTTRRGPTFVFTATLRTPQKYPAAKWVLAGVCLLMEVEE